jgi:hypothetical protein
MNSMAATADLNALLGYDSDDEVLTSVATVTNGSTATGKLAGLALFLCMPATYLLQSVKMTAVDTGEAD